MQYQQPMTSKRTLRRLQPTQLTRSKPPKTNQSQNLPFIPPDQEQVKRPEPTNQIVLERAEKLKQDLHGLVSDPITECREFFLTEIAPLSLAFFNGIADAKEVLTVALGEDPGMDPIIMKGEAYMLAAIRSKLATFVRKFMKLSAEEESLFLARIVSSEVTDINLADKLMKELQVMNKKEQTPAQETPVRKRRTTKEK